MFAAAQNVTGEGEYKPISWLRGRVFYGWWIALTSALALFLGPVPVAVFAFGVFLRPLVHDFHSSRGGVSLARIFFSVVFALGSPLAGRLIDRWGERRIILASSTSAGLLLLAACFPSHHIWQLYIFYSGLGLITCGISPVPYCAVVSHWFDRNRGLALGVMMLGLGLGASLMPSAAQYLILRFGWRETFAMVGAAMLLINAPISTVFLKDRPEQLGLFPDGKDHARTTPGARPADSGMSWREARGDSTFWVLCCAFVLVSASVQACFAHIASVLADRGVGIQASAFATSLFGAGVLTGRTGSGYLLDRFFAPRVAGLLFMCAAAGIELLRVTSSREIAFIAAFFIGLGLGAEVDIMAYLISRYFGLFQFGTIYGITFAAFGLAGALGTYLMGVGFDEMGSYSVMLNIYCVATFLGAILILRLRPYRYQVHGGGCSVKC